MTDAEIKALKKINRYLFERRSPQFDSIEKFRSKYLSGTGVNRPVNKLPILIARFPGDWNGAGGMVHHFNLGIHRQAADWYCKNYYIENDKLPIGKHIFYVRFGCKGGYDVTTPIGNSSGIKEVSMKFILCSNDLDESFIDSLFISLNYRVRW